MNSISYSKSFFKSVLNSISSFFKESSGLSFLPTQQRLTVFLVLTLVAAATYVNTLGHQMAYDDEQVIRKNDFVLKGIKGIPDIFKHDTYYSFYKNNNLKNILPGGRYRPLSIATFALEQQLVGVKNDSVPIQFIWDVNGNGIVDPDEDTIQDGILSQEDFYARGLGLRHFINVLLFTLTVGLLYIFFSVYFKILPAELVFFACLLFAVHPIHTEVVANIKSRDEILSLFFVSLSLLFSFRYAYKSVLIDCILAALFLFLALLSKEYAVLLLFLVPISVYFADLDCFKKTQKKELIFSFGLVLIFVFLTILSFKQNWCLLLLIAYFIIHVYINKSAGIHQLVAYFGLSIMLYFYMRLNATNDLKDTVLFSSNIISNPYLLATSEQLWATKIYVLFKYIKLLLLPYPLISDYSYSTIIYRSFFNWEVICSIIVYLISTVLFILFLIKRKPLGFFLFIFLSFFFLVANIFVDIGATMGERLMYHSSLGVCFIIVWPIKWCFDSLWSRKKIIVNFLFCFYSIVVLAFFILSVNRNRDWENNEKLFHADLPKAPQNIVLLSGEARNLYLNAERIKKDTTESNKLLRESITLVDKGLNINGAYTPLYQTLALDFFLLKEYDNAVSSAKACLKLDSLDIISKTILISVAKQNILLGLQQFKQKNYTNAISYFDASIKLDPFNTDAYYNKAYCLKKLNDTTNAITLLKKALEIEPKKEIKGLLNQLE
jgi:hypothetical protein